tara:strand:- start:380 stop:1063 length:684 start_codon:yes stop_codon:yes gene_type:complete
MNVLITGTSSGLGYELAKECVARGDTVFGISRSKSDLDINQEICDFYNLQEIPTALNSLIGSNTIDIVILNAGMLGTLSKTRDVSIDEFGNIFKVNVLANKVIVDWLLNNNIKVKTIIGISTGAALKTYYGWSLYCTSKAAFKQLISTYAQEESNVHFISIAPGVIKTKMQDYINGIDVKIIPSVEKFQSMYNTMITPDVIAKKLIQLLPKLKDFKSGSYIDLRDLQ